MIFSYVTVKENILLLNDTVVVTSTAALVKVDGGTKPVAVVVVLRA
jgi:hypothetical protein